MTDRQLSDQTFGVSGATYESGTTAVTGTFCAIHALADTVISAITWEGLDGDSAASMPIPAGDTIFGRISAFTLTSGKVLAYKRAA